MGWTTLVGAALLTCLSRVFDSPSEFGRLGCRQWAYGLDSAIFPLAYVYLVSPSPSSGST